MSEELREQVESTPLASEASVSEDREKDRDQSEDSTNDEDETRSTSSHDEEEEDESSDETEDREPGWRVDNVDRLSLLPNELLAEIFDLAHPLHDPPRGPLSKRLEPFYDFALYHRISPRSERQLQRFIRKINANPNLAQRIEEFQVDYLCDLGSFPVSITPAEVLRFYSHLTSAKEIEFSYECMSGSIFHPFQNAPDPPSLPRLECLVITSSLINNRPLRMYTTFTQLRSLTVTLYDVVNTPAPISPTIQLPFLVKLSISGDRADDSSVATLCRSCPSLSSLTLSTYRPRYAAIIRELPKTLTTLILRNQNHESDETEHFCDHLLHHFDNLRHLELDNHLFSQQLPHHLTTHVQELESLRLGNGWIPTSDLIDYIQRPDSRLKSVSLDLVHIWPGYQCVDSVTIGNTIKVGQLPEEDDDWIWGDWWQGPFEPGNGDKVEEARKLLDVAKEAGVEIDKEGSLEWSIQTYWLFLVEVSNIAILRTYRDQDFAHYEDVLDDPDLNLCLPRLDLDNLDVDNLQLVRKHSYDHNCYYFTLENEVVGTKARPDHAKVVLADFGDGKGPR